MTDWTEEPVIGAGKRLGVQEPKWMGGDWFTSWSPRNGNNNAEGMWCQWVHMARLILADERTATEMPEFFVPYEDAPHLYDEHHPRCTQSLADNGQAIAPPEAEQNGSTGAPQ